ncbi:MAG: DUF2339 domain-containing protein [Actinophytocola sp.]|uniref:DUF2339 domain-containing protein n=1 Tax=Actinophytocola sp. TaxID=1872138 RepID=UPI003C76CE44
MADQISASLPRLADALLEVGTRLGEIGAELHALRSVPPEVAADHVGTPGASGFAASTPGAGTNPAATGQGAAANTPSATGTDAPTSTAPASPAPGSTTSGPTTATPTPSGHSPTATGPTPAYPGHSAPHPAASGPPTPRYAASGYAPPGYAAPGYAAFGPAPSWHAAPGSFRSGPGAPPPPQAQWRPPEPPGPTLWERLSRDGAGSRILAWAGGVVTLAGVVLLLVLAIQRGYLGPVPRVLLGAGLGLALAGIGAWLHRSPTARTGAYALAATGIAVLYLDVVAATSLYHFLPVWGGLVAGLAVTAGGVAVAGRWGSQLLAVFVVVCCAVSAPVITGGFDTLLLSFLLVLLVGTTPVQLAKRWGGLLLAAGLPPVVACVINIGLANALGGDAAITAVLAGVTSGVVILLATATALRRHGDDFALVMLFVGPVPGMLAALLFPRLGAAILPAAVGTLLLGVWVLGLRTSLPRVFAQSAGGMGALAFLQATATAFDGDARAIAFLAEALIIAVLAVRIRLAVALVPAAVFGFIGLVLALAYSARPDMVTQPPRWPLGTSQIVALGLTGIVLAATAIVLCWAAFRLEVLAREEYAPHGWISAGVLALYGSTAALLAVGLLISPDRNGFLLGHVLVTVSWTVSALVLLLRGIDSVPMRVAGLSLVVAALAKLVLFDLSSLDGMARVAAFLVAGLVLLAAGARYAKLVAARARP